MTDIHGIVSWNYLTEQIKLMVLDQAIEVHPNKGIMKIDLFVLNWNTWKHLTVGKNWIIGIS